MQPEKVKQLVSELGESFSDLGDLIGMAIKEVPAPVASRWSYTQLIINKLAEEVDDEYGP